MNDDTGPATTGRRDTGPGGGHTGTGPASDASSGNANTLDRWTDAVTRALGIDGAIDRDLILDMTKDVAHGVARPAAPLTAYLLGVAVGAGADPVDCAARLSRLAGQWSDPPVPG